MAEPKIPTNGSINLTSAPALASVETLLDAFKDAASHRIEAVNAVVNSQGLDTFTSAFKEVILSDPLYRSGRLLVFAASAGFFRAAYFPNTSDAARERLRQQAQGMIQRLAAISDLAATTAPK